MAPYFGGHHITRKILVAFMEFFAGISIEKYNADGTGRKFVSVPVQYAAGDKWLLTLNTQHKHVMEASDHGPHSDRIELEWTLPRISVNMTGMTYDSQRHINKLNRIANAADAAGSKTRVYAPVPYNLDVDVTIISRNIDTNFQILEQIIPWFSPSKSIDVKIYEELGAESVPIVLQSVNTDYPEEMDETEVRLYTCTLSFNVKANYYLPKKQQKIVKQVQDNIRAIGPNPGEFGVNPTTGLPFQSLEEAYAYQASQFDPAFGKFDQFVQNAQNPNPFGDAEDRANKDLNPVSWLRFHVEDGEVTQEGSG